MTIPSSVIQRMALAPGEYLDVTVRIPKTEEYENDELLTLPEYGSAEDQSVNGDDTPATKKLRRKKNETE